MIFADRHDAGRQLAAKLLRFKNEHPVILALPRGGVPVGFDVAKALNAPLDSVLVRKIGHPLSHELAIGALAEGDGLSEVLDAQIIADFNIPPEYIKEEIARQTEEIRLRRQLYFKKRQPIDIHHRTVIVVDDGIATGSTMLAALRAIRRREPAKLVLAVPVAPPAALAELRVEVDEIVCLLTPEDFGAVGSFYEDFRPVSDKTVTDMLDQASRSRDK